MYMLITMGLLILAGNTWYAHDIWLWVSAFSDVETKQLSHIPPANHLDVVATPSRQR